MKPERVIATDKALEPFVQELNSKLVERLQDIDGSEMDLGAVLGRLAGYRVGDAGVVSNQDGEPTKLVFEFQTERGRWVPYTLEQTWETGLLKRRVLKDSQSHVLGTWNYIWAWDSYHWYIRRVDFVGAA